MPKSVDGDIRISVKFDNDGIKQGVKSTESAVAGLQSSLGKLGKAVAAAFSVAAIVNFGKQAIGLASDIDEVQNVVDTAFGSMAYKCEAFADSAIENFGMSKLSAKQTASTYMAMAKSMGLSMESASDMAVEVAKLTGDVASFYNLDQSTAATKLKSIFTGETETLKDLGVVMTETNLKEYALSKGITKSYAAMSQAEKVSLRYGYVTEALSDASGDFVRTQDSWANQTRILSERWKEFMSEIGGALITVLTPLLQLLNSIVAALTAFARKVNQLAKALAGSKAGEEQAASIAESVDNQNALTAAVKGTAKEQKKALAGFDEINKLSSGTTAAAESSSDGIGILAGGAGENSTAAESAPAWADQIKQSLASVSAWMRETWAPTISQAVNTVSPSIDQLKIAFSGIFGDVGTLAEPVETLFTESVIPFLQTGVTNCATIVSGAISTISTILSGAWSSFIFPVLQTGINTAYPVILGFFGNVGSIATQIFGIANNLIQKVFTGGVMPALSLLSQVFTGVWEGIATAYNTWAAPIFSGVEEAIGNIGRMLTNCWEGLVKPVWTEIVAALTEIWEQNLKPLWDNILDFVGELVDCALVIYNQVVAPILLWVQQKVYPAVAGVINGIIGQVKILLAGIIGAVNGIVTVLKGVVQFIKGVFTGDWQGAWNGIKNIFKGVWDSLVAIVKIPVNLIIEMINKMLEGVIGGINKIVGAINTLSFDVPDWVPGIGGETFGFNLKEIPIPRIPKLATGAVIPANREFLAVLGDQRSGTNVEAPLATIEQAVANVLSRMGGFGTQQAVLEIDGEKFGKLIYRLNKREGKRVGVSFSGT